MGIYIYIWLSLVVSLCWLSVIYICNCLTERACVHNSDVHMNDGRYMHIWTVFWLSIKCPYINDIYSMRVFTFFWSTWKCIELQPQPNSHNLTKELTTASGLSNPNRPTRRLYIILTCSHLHCLEISICTPSTHVHVHTDVILRHVYTAEVLLRTTHVY